MEPEPMHSSIKLDHTLVAVEDEHTVNVLLELTAPEVPADDARPPLKLALVLDRSGSMHGPKLEVTKACAAWLVRRLNANDEVGIVTYDDAVDLLAPLAPVDADAVVHALGHVFAGGTTNLSGGWLKGLEM